MEFRWRSFSARRSDEWPGAKIRRYQPPPQKQENDSFMKRLAYVLATFLLCSAAISQQHPAPSGKPKPATLMSGLGDLHHPVSTSNQEAQKFFDQGLRLIFAFNHEEATNSFRRAAELD